MSIKPLADKNITITIPDAHTTRAQDAFNGLADQELEISGLNTTKVFNIQGQQAGETAEEFGERFIKQALKQFVRLWEQKGHDDDYMDDISSITRVEESVPEIFT